MNCSTLAAAVAVVLLSMSPCWCQAPPAEVQRALEAVQNGDIDTGLKIFTKRAEAGEVKSMLTLGVWLSEGQLVKQDFAKAMEWFIRAFEKGDLRAANHIAIMYRDSEGVAQDLELAFALVSISMRKAAQTPTREADDVLRSCERVMEKIMPQLTAEQLARGEALAKRQWTADDLRKHKPAATAARQKLRLLPEGSLDRLPKRYSLNAARNREAYAGVKITAVREDKFESAGFGQEAFASNRIDDAEKIVKEGIYRNERGRFEIRVPKLAAGQINVHQTTFGSGQAGLSHQVRFMEDDGWLLGPAPADKNAGWHAVVETLQVPPQLKGKEFAQIEGMQKRFTANLSTEFQMGTLEGDLGPVFQTVVVNRVASRKYPQTEVRISPPCFGLKTIGINRLFIQDGSTLVEIGLIVAKPPEMKAEDFVSYAVAQMDIYMSGFKLLPAR